MMPRLSSQAEAFHILEKQTHRRFSLILSKKYVIIFIENKGKILYLSQKFNFYKEANYAHRKQQFHLCIRSELENHHRKTRNAKE